MIRRARLTVLCALVGYLLSGMALTLYRLVALAPDGARRRRSAR